MSRLLDYLLEDETAVVFDIDGVLAIYEFGELGHSACPDGDWERYVREADPYATTRAPRQLQAFVTQRVVAAKASGVAAPLFACSVAQDFEAPGKIAFVTRNYDIPQSHIRMVSNKAQKLGFLQEVRDELALPEQRVALVEDSTATLDYVAQNSAFVTVHISSFFDYEPGYKQNSTSSAVSVG